MSVLVARRGTLRGLALWGLLGVASAGCSGTATVPPGGSGAAGTGENAGAAGEGGVPSPGVDVTPGSTGHENSATQARTRCESSQVGAPLLRRLTRDEYARTLTAAFGEVSGFTGVSLGVDSTARTGFSNDASVLVVGTQTAREFQQTAEELSAALVTPGELSARLPCAASAADEGCARQFLEGVAPALYRRPLEPGELEEYLDVYRDLSAEAGFAEALRWTLASLFQSPHVIYRSEIGTNSGASYELSPYEIASELAYSFSGGPPSPSVIARAEQGELTEPAARVAVAREMLQGASGEALVQTFFKEWLGYSQVLAEVRSDNPAFEAAREAMVEETERFVQQVVFTEGGATTELLTAPYTVVGSELSAFYGFPATSDWSVVQRDPDWGTGLLAQGSLLATYANSEASSPTQRGLVVFERLLCNERPPVPPNVSNLDATVGEGATTRERIETVHTAQDSCRGCHAQFDPIGFAFEHFDQVGRYRETENGAPIDASGSLTLASGAALSFDGLTDLSTQLAAQPEVGDCLSGLTALYYFGGAGGGYCLAEDARTRFGSGELSLLDYIAELAAAPHFTSRVAP